MIERTFVRQCPATEEPEAVRIGEPEVQSVREWRFSLREADQERVENSVGWPLYTHMRGIPRIVAFRRRALDGAHELYKTALAEVMAETGISARGLLVLQRAGLAVEDLGGLLFALGCADPFVGLTATKIDDIDRVFVDLFEGRADPAELFRLPTPELIEGEYGLSDVARRAFHNLREITLAALKQDLLLVGTFWMSHRKVAKRTLHGFGLVASAHVFGPPPAGQLVEFVAAGQPRPFALSLITTRNDQTLNVNTEYQVVDLAAETVDLIHRSGCAALELIELLESGWLFGLRTGGFALPTKLVDELPHEERLALEERQAKSDGDA